MNTLRLAAIALLFVSPQDKPHEIPFELTNHIILVKGEINGKGPQTFVFDSGASETIVTPETAEALGIKGSPAGNGMTAGRAETVSLGGATVKNVQVVIWDPPQAQPLKQLGVTYNGILGYSFLSQFLVTLDYRRKVITLAPHDAAPAKETSAFGARFDGTKVKDVEKGSKAEKAGLKKDDDVYRVNGLSIDKASELGAIVTIAKSGDELRFSVNRGKEKKELRLAK